MIRTDVVRLPRELRPDEHIAGRVVVVFDVLRATTTMVTALAAGAEEIRVFDSLDAASKAFEKNSSIKLLCGERDCLPPPGFDLGNSPGDFTQQVVRGKTIFMSTTNGTRAIVAANGAACLMVASLVNASATARAIAGLGLDVTLLCAGTNGEPAPEDMIGAGAVAESLGMPDPNPATREAVNLFLNSRDQLAKALRNTKGGQNVIRTGLEKDIEFAARLDVFDIAVQVSGDPPVARRMIRA